MAAAQQQGQGSDNSLAPLWIIGLSFIVGGLLWYFFHTQIVAAFFKIKLFEAYLVSWAVAGVNPLIDVLKTVNPSTVSFDDMMAVGTAIGNYIRYPLIVIMLLLAFFLYRCDITAQYRRIYSMKSLRELEASNWPQITPVVKLDLVKQDIDEGSWAMAMSPFEFAKRYNLLKVELYRPDQVRQMGAEGKYVVKRGEAKRIFTMQLGDAWDGVDALNQHTKALFAIFAAKQNRDRDGANKMLTQIARSTATGKLDFSGTDELLKKHINSTSVKKVLDRHAYVLTVMASMLERSRDDGVFASADFLWLKPVDRRLWFLLNTVGRQTPFAEISGPFAHWVTEKELKRRLLVPMVDEAVRGLEVAISEIKYVPQDTVSEA